jgi:hypothetical protein
MNTICRRKPRHGKVQCGRNCGREENFKHQNSNFKEAPKFKPQDAFGGRIVTAPVLLSRFGAWVLKLEVSLKFDD